MKRKVFLLATSFFTAVAWTLAAVLTVSAQQPITDDRATPEPTAIVSPPVVSETITTILETATPEPVITITRQLTNEQPISTTVNGMVINIVVSVPTQTALIRADLAQLYASESVTVTEYSAILPSGGTAVIEMRMTAGDAAIISLLIVSISIRAFDTMRDMSKRMKATK